MTDAAREERKLALGLGALGAYQLVLGGFMVVSPHAFFTSAGPFGTENSHYIRDVSTFYLALGAVMLLAARRPSWRVAVLAFAALQYALHAVNHLIDIGHAHREGVGPGDFLALLLLAAVLGWLLRLALRSTPA